MLSSSLGAHSETMCRYTLSPPSVFGKTNVRRTGSSFKYVNEGVDKFAMVSLEQIFLDSGTQFMIPLKYSHSRTTLRLSKCV